MVLEEDPNLRTGSDDDLNIQRIKKIAEYQSVRAADELIEDLPENAPPEHFQALFEKKKYAPTRD
jgi:hypothetical protein